MIRITSNTMEEETVLEKKNDYPADFFSSYGNSQQQLFSGRVKKRIIRFLKYGAEYFCTPCHCHTVLLL